MQAVDDGQEMPSRLLTPEGIVWELQVAPAVVVVMTVAVSDPADPDAVPMAKQMAAEGHDTPLRPSTPDGTLVAFVHVVPPSTLVTMYGVVG
jgi:hypothetical protein